MDDQISLMESMILVHNIFLMSVKGFSNIRSFSSALICWVKPFFLLISSAKLIFDISYFYSKVVNFSFTFCSSVTWSFISSMDLIKSSVLCVGVPVCDVPVTSMGAVVAKGIFGAKAGASVEGTTVETIGTAV